MGKTEAGKRIVISDAGPLIHLDELDCLDLIDYPEVLVSEAVWREVARHRPQALHSPAINLKLNAVDALSSRVAAVSPLFGLHHGEQEVLTLCIQTRDSLFLTDDAAARMAADSLKVPARGTIGLIIRGVRRHLRTPQEGLNLLGDIPNRSSLHIRPALLERILRQVGQEWG